MRLREAEEVCDSVEEPDTDSVGEALGVRDCEPLDDGDSLRDPVTEVVNDGVPEALHCCDAVVVEEKDNGAAGLTLWLADGVPAGELEPVELAEKDSDWVSVNEPERDCVCDDVDDRDAVLVNEGEAV